MENERLEAFMEAVKTQAVFTIGEALYSAVPAGKGKIVYGAKLDGSGLPAARGALMPVAVIDTEGAAHILDGNSAAHFGIRGRTLPDGVKRFSPGETKQAADLALLDMIDAMPVFGTALSDDDIFSAECLAWKLALEPDHAGIRPETAISEGSLLRILLGEDTPAALAERQFAENREHYARKKAIRAKAEELALRHGDSEEVRLYRSIAASDAKHLSVTFTREGLSATGRISPFCVMNVVTNRMRFSECHFQTKASHKKVFDALFGVKTGHWNDDLFPSDITEIRHGKEILFTRKNAEGGAA